MHELVKIENGEIVVEQSAVEQLKNFNKLKAKMDILEKEIKAGLKEKMESAGIKKFMVPGMAATIREATIRKSLDSKRMKEEIPDVYEEYLKESQVASSITLTFEE